MPPKTSHKSQQPRNRTGTRAAVKRPHATNPSPYDLTIFLSHKSHDHTRALEIKSAFERNSAGRVHVFVSGLDIDPGVSWEDAIDEAMLEADIFILLYTDPADNWNWSLFESGFFTAKVRGAAKKHARGIHSRLICLHHPDVLPPDQLKSWQSLPATREKVTQFIREIYADVNPPLVRDDASRAELDRFVDIVITQVPGATGVSFTFTHEFSVKLTPENMNELKKRRQMPASAKIEISPDTLREVFGLASPGKESTWTWDQFVQSLAANPTHVAQLRWIEYLPNAIARLNDRQAGTPILPLLRQSQAQQADARPVLYRPIILERSHLAGQWTAFRIILAHTLDAMTSVDETDRLFFLLLQARNASHSILPPCRGTLRMVRARGNDAMTEASLRDIWSDVQINGVEAINRGWCVPEQVAELFPDAERPELLSSIGDYRRASGELKAAVDQVDPDAAGKALDEMHRICNGFLRRIAARYAEVIAPTIKTRNARDVAHAQPAPMQPAHAKPVSPAAPQQ